MYQPTEVTFTDPRDFDGTPYEVAEAAVEQALGILGVLEQALDAANIMARNAHMERNIATGNPPAGSDWPLTAEGLTWITVSELSDEMKRKLRVLGRAAVFNPRQPGKS